MKHRFDVERPVGGRRARPKTYRCQECGFFCKVGVQRCEHTPWWETIDAKLKADCAALSEVATPRFQARSFDQIRHGSSSAYNYWRCPCAVCKEAARVRRRKYVKPRAA